MRALLGQRMRGLLLVMVTNAVTAVVAAAEPFAGEWTHIENVPGGTACAARLTGNEVDTMLMLNQNGELLLVAGRADWHASGSQEITLRIDDLKIDHLTANAFNNLVLLQISDDAVLQRLRAAKDLYWRLSFGSYHAMVAGLGAALDWVHACEQGKRLGLGVER